MNGYHQDDDQLKKYGAINMHTANGNVDDNRNLSHDQLVARVQSFYDYLKETRNSLLDGTPAERLTSQELLDDLLDEYVERFYTILDH